MKNKGFKFPRALIGTATVMASVMMGCNCMADPANMSKGKDNTTLNEDATSPAKDQAGESPTKTAAFSTGTLSGRLLDPEGKPLADHRVSFSVLKQNKRFAHNSPQAQPMQASGYIVTDSAGYFLAPEMGEFQEILLSVSTESYAMYCEVFKYPVWNKEIRLQKPFTKFSGTVVNRSDKSGVADAEITIAPRKSVAWNRESVNSMSLVGDRLHLQTDSAGHFETNRLPPGEILLNAMTTSGLQMVPAVDGFYTTTTIVADASVTTDILMYPGYTIVGKVTSSVDNTPIAGAKVWFPDGGELLGGYNPKPVFTNQNGEYKLSNAPPMPGFDRSDVTFPYLYVNAEGYKESKAKNLYGGPLDLDQLVITQDFEVTPE